MPSLIMERGKQKRQNMLADGFNSDLMNAGRICFSCEQIFANRKCLEEHMCSSASFICSCGTEFTYYKDMLEHSTTHEPGHQVLDHETIRKRRIEKRKEEEEKLKRLQKGEVVWKSSKLENVPPASLPVMPMLQLPNTSAYMSQAPIQSAQISQVPQLYPSVSQASLLPNPRSSATDMQNIFASVGAPTVDLWTLYQPVVVVQTVRKFNKKKPYTCGKCGQGFMTKASLVSHHSSHATDKVSGCIGCGLLLSSRKLVPRFHVCNSPNNVTKLKLITAKPLGYKMPNAASTVRKQNPISQGPQAIFSHQMKNPNLSAISKGSLATHISPTLQLKNQNIRAYYRTGHGLHTTSSVQKKTITNPVSGGLSKPTQTFSTSKEFPCRVCHLPFETPQLLQRHKCIKAQEFMAQQMRGGKQHYKLKRMTPVASPNPAQMNGERQVGVLPSSSMKTNQVMAVSLDKGQGVVPVNGKTGVDLDNDCYIVESGPDKPAEMIYQVTSSVPIKT